ncbi:hypothetical protein [Clostridium thermarum]|uniref:hypothetical protein n=1 Tax=Clostridium thermarum TaxID=1716543 RepID=UPI0013D09E88|nr:hypothetical protein [Clostridium thermarum]
MIEKITDVIKRYLKLIVPIVAVNLVLAFIICVIRGAVNLVEYSNMLFGVGGMVSGLGLLSFLGNVKNRGNVKQRRLGTLIYKDQEEMTEEDSDSEKKSINFLMVAAISGIITILLSGLVLKFR